MSVTRQRILRLALAVVVGLVVGLVVDVARAGGPRLWLARHGLPAPYLPQGTVVSVGEGAFYLDCRGTGSPTVVLEAGAGSGAGSWGGVIDDIAATTRTCAYDRAGIGRSDARGRRTLRLAAADLRALLDVAGERPPFVVVGHSLGGSYARVFAATYRAETPGLVLLDSFDPDLERDFVHPLLGTLAARYEERLRRLEATVEAWEELDWAASDRELREARLDGVRIRVLAARRVEPRVDRATNERLRDAWKQGYDTLSPGLTTYEYAEGSGHLIPIDRPDLVVEVVRRLVLELRAAG